MPAEYVRRLNPSAVLNQQQRTHDPGLTTASPNTVKGFKRGSSKVQQKFAAYSWSAIESQSDGR